jgi:hypothetical protein
MLYVALLDAESCETAENFATWLESIVNCGPETSICKTLRVAMSFRSMRSIAARLALTIILISRKRFLHHPPKCDIYAFLS